MVGTASMPGAVRLGAGFPVGTAPTKLGTVEGTAGLAAWDGLAAGLARLLATDGRFVCRDVGGMTADRLAVASAPCSRR